VSRQHGSVLVEADRIVYRDEGSHNGSLVNDRPVESCTLSDQDVIMIGQTRIKVSLG
jgi:pSer/pThr/pTyr-binding forkhead associated (FHA) protein